MFYNKEKTNPMISWAFSYFNVYLSFAPPLVLLEFITKLLLVCARVHVLIHKPGIFVWSSDGN